MTYHIETTTQEHVDQLAQTMRAADRAEVWAMSHLTGKQALEAGLVSRDTKTGMCDDTVLCVYGCSSFGTVLHPMATPWMLSSDSLPLHYREFLRQSKEVIAGWKREYHLLINFVDARNTVAIRWLRWLGFHIEDAILAGEDNIPFHEFSIGKAGVPNV